MDADYIRQLFEYNAWANRRMMDACASLAPAQLTQNVGGSFGSLRNTLAHIVDVEWLYLERWQGRAADSLPKADSYGDVAALRARFEEVARDYDAHLGKLSATEVGREIRFQNTKGTAYRHPLWQMLVHLVNHSTYHRGQVTVLLRSLGVKANATDMIAFFRERSGQP